MTVHEKHDLYAIPEYNLYCCTHFSRYNQENLVSSRDISYLTSFRKANANKDDLVQDTPQTEKFRRKRLKRGFKPLRLKRGKEVEEDEIDEPDTSVAFQRPAVSEKVLRKAQEMAKQMIDFEAVLSGSDSGDESNVESDNERLSGDFINDGTYTQNSDHCDEGFYHRVHRQLEESPDSAEQLRFNFRGAENGLPLIERIYCREKKAEKKKREHKHDENYKIEQVDLGIGSRITKKFKRSKFTFDEDDETIPTPILSGNTNQKESDAKGDKKTVKLIEEESSYMKPTVPHAIANLFTPDSTFLSEDDW
jgi:hypothetical protein